jgi:hypothetical protein
LKYPISVPADGLVLRAPRSSVALLASDAARVHARHWGLLAALAVTFAVHAPTLHYYFTGDDFVVLGDIQHRGNVAFLIDTVRMHDLVPNWRPLTGAVYLVEWRLFGLDATMWRLVNLGVHLGSVGLLYAFVLRVTRRPAVAAVSALIFGVSGAHFDTVSYITALPHVLALFFVLASLLSMVAYAEDGERNIWAYGLSFGAFTLAFLTNEGSFVFAPMLVLAYIVFSARWRTSPIRLVLHAAPFVALAAGWLSFYESCTCQQLKFDGYSWGPHVFGNYAVYLSWLAYPAHAIPHHPDALRWAIAGVVTAAALALAVRGPKFAAVAVAGIVLGLLPFAPVKIWTASRYTYDAVAFFAPLAAILAYGGYARVRDVHPRARMPAGVVALALVAVIAGLYSWQTYARNEQSGQATERWQLLVSELRASYPTVPPDTTIFIIDGPWTNPMEQYLWVPSVARALYTDAAAFDLPSNAYAQGDLPPYRRAVFLQWRGGELTPVFTAQAPTAGDGGRTAEVRGGRR